jgi:hypothetical protein
LDRGCYFDYRSVLNITMESLVRLLRLRLRLWLRLRHRRRLNVGLHAA